MSSIEASLPSMAAAGLPGARWTSANTTRETMNKIGRTESRRFAIYFFISTLL